VPKSFILITKPRQKASTLIHQKGLDVFCMELESFVSVWETTFMIRLFRFILLKKASPIYGRKEERNEPAR
jgi:hypothetical protein